MYTCYLDKFSIVTTVFNFIRSYIYFIFWHHLYKGYFIFHLQGKLYTIMEICRIFDGIYKEHLDGMYASDSFYTFGWIIHLIPLS